MVVKRFLTIWDLGITTGKSDDYCTIACRRFIIFSTRCLTDHLIHYLRNQIPFLDIRDEKILYYPFTGNTHGSHIFLRVQRNF